MVKPNQRHIHRAPGKKQQNNVSTKVDGPPDEQDWMVVKKQRITILIPPLPSKAQSTMPNVGDCHPQENPRSINSHSSKQPVYETEKSMSSSHKQAIIVQPPTMVHPPEPKLMFHQKPSSLCHRTASDNSPRQGIIGKCSSTSKGSKGMMIFAPDCSGFINQRMRASYLEKKLKKAGGLENWLISLGLNRFVKFFQTRSVNKFQLANLNMKKLKDMGADAVGPRRKLIHAIDCLCHPHCFQRV